MKRILIVDDDHIICEMLEYFFEHKGYKVHIIEKFENNFKNLKLPEVDLILLDKRLGNLDGTLLCEKIKSSYVTSKIPIIMMSALESAKKGCLLAGADDFLEKPFEIQNMLFKVEHFLY